MKRLKNIFSASWTTTRTTNITTSWASNYVGSTSILTGITTTWNTNYPQTTSNITSHVTSWVASSWISTTSIGTAWSTYWTTSWTIPNSVCSSANSVENTIIGYYKLYFNRCADAAGLAFWVAEVNAGRMTVAQVGTTFSTWPTGRNLSQAQLNFENCGSYSATFNNLNFCTMPTSSVTSATTLWNTTNINIASATTSYNTSWTTYFPVSTSNVTNITTTWNTDKIANTSNVTNITTSWLTA